VKRKTDNSSKGQNPFELPWERTVSIMRRRLKMKKILLAIVSVIVIAAIVYGGIKVYAAGYSGGQSAGYENGYSAGQEGGYGSGKQDGYKEGEASGYGTGKVEGYSLGEAEGYASGTEAGYRAGYDKGLEEGLGHGYTINDPTYDQAVTFMKQDSTDQNKYVDPTYICSHFARDVCNNAEARGIRCAFAEIRYKDGGHALVAFNTIDKGLVYFESQTDEVARPIIGKRLYQCIEPRPGYYYPSPSYDDTIIDILVIW
jgi:hypothetical protein